MSTSGAKGPALGAEVPSSRPAPIPVREVFDTKPAPPDSATLLAWLDRLVADPTAVTALPPSLRDHVQLFTAVIDKQPALYPLLSEELRGNWALASAYLFKTVRRPDGSADPAPLTHLPLSLLANPDVRGQLIGAFDTLSWLPASLRTPEVLARALQYRPTLLRELSVAEIASLPGEDFKRVAQILTEPHRILELGAGSPDAMRKAFLAAADLPARIPAALWANDQLFSFYTQLNVNDARTAVRSDALARLPEAVRLAHVDKFPSALLLGDSVAWLPSQYQTADTLAYVVTQRPALVKTVPPPLGTSAAFLARVTSDATLRFMTDAQLAAAPVRPETHLERLARDPTGLSTADLGLARQVAQRSPEATRRFPEALRDDLSVMRPVLAATNGRALEWAGPALKRDQALVADAVAADPQNFSFAAPQLRADPTFVRELLPLAAEHPLRSALRYAAPELRASRAFAESMVDAYGALFSELDGTLRSDAGLARRALLSSLDAVDGVDAPIDDKALMLELVAKNGSFLVKASPRLKADPHVLEAAIRTAPAMGPPASMPEPDRTRLDLLAVARWPLRIKFFKPEDPRTAVLLEAAAQKDARVLGLRGREEVPEGVRRALADLAAKRPDLAQAADALATRFKAQGITRPERLGFPQTALQLLANRETSRPDGRPLAIAVYSPDDWNGGLSAGEVEHLNKGYRVLYFEATQDSGLVDVLARGTAQQKASLVLLAGHGSQRRMALGAEDPQASVGVAPEVAYLDTSDEAQLRDAGLDARLEKDATVVLVSCSTGRGAPGDNVAGMLSRALPTARILAPLVSTNGAVQVDAQGRFVDPGYDVGPGFTLAIPPRS